MATAPIEPSSKRKPKRRTSHLKQVPPALELREALRAACDRLAAKLDKRHPLTKDDMEQLARRLLEQEGQPEGYVGWTMVVLASAFWRDQVAAVPPDRRLFLLPHCLKHAEGCPADYDEFGLNCEQCGACSIADFRGMAEQMGYRVLVAEGSPVVLKIIVSGYVDAVVGVACLNVLEKAIDKILLAGIPCMAVPLLSSDCRNTSVDESWGEQMLRLRTEACGDKTHSYLPIMREASQLFEPSRLEELAPRLRGGPRLAEVGPDELDRLDPIAATEAIAYDFLSRGGKYSRPFITLAVCDALCRGPAQDAMDEGADHSDDGSTELSAPADRPIEDRDSVRRAALAIEAFHKASLVHDDIEDDDAYRYADPTLHRRYGIPTAINVGDYLIGLGYRLVSRERERLGAERAADILDILADAHLRLSEGQGAELIWRDARDQRLRPLDALKVYALKTAPAFEAALLSGARLAGPVDGLAKPLKDFARNLGIGFQIINDLKDWLGDIPNKRDTGTDLLGGRPTLLWALACDVLDDKSVAQLLALPGSSGSTERRLAEARRLFLKADVFNKALRLVDKHRERAERAVAEVAHEPLSRLLTYLLDTVWDRPDESAFLPPDPIVIPLPMETEAPSPR